MLEKIRKEKARLVKEKKIKKDKNESIIYRGEDNSYYEKIIATGEVKCIDDEIPFEVPKGWEWARMTMVLDVRDGTHDTPNYIQQGYPLITGKDFFNGYFDLSKTQYISQTDYLKIIERSKVEIGDILFSMIGGNIGSQILITEDNYFDMAIKNVALFKHYKNGLISSLYLSLFLQKSTPDFKAIASGGAQAFVSLKQLRNYLIPIPPVKEQKRIVSKIENLIKLINKYEELQLTYNSINDEITKELKKSILQEAIQGKLVPQIAEEGTAQELLKKIKLEKQKLVKEGKLKKTALSDSVIFKSEDNRYYEQTGKAVLDITDEIPFDLPDNWCWVRLEDIVNLYTGNSISEQEKLTKYSNVLGIDYIGTKDVDFDNVVNYKNGISIPDKYVNGFKIAPSQSILLCIEGGSAGRKIAQIDRNVCFGNKLCCFVPYDLSISKYIYYYLQSPSFFENFKGNISGIIGGVSLNRLKNLFIPLPPLLEQHRIVTQIERIFEKFLIYYDGVIGKTSS